MTTDLTEKVARAIVNVWTGLPWEHLSKGAHEEAMREAEAAIAVVEANRPRHTGYPEYCPDGLGEDEICPSCGASKENLLPCGALRNGPRPRSSALVELTVVHR